MKILPIFLCLIALIISDDPYKKEKDVLVINENNFGMAIQEFKFLLLLLYSEDDPNCKEIIPVFEKTASLLKEENFVCGKIDADKSPRIIHKYRIDTFPSIMLIRRTDPLHYNGVKKPEEIMSWLKDETKKEIEKVSNKTELEKIIKQHDFSMVYFGKSEQVIHEIHLAYREIEDMPVGISNSDNLTQEFAESPDKKEFIIFFSKYDNGKHYLYDLKKEKIIEIFELYSYPKVIEFSARNSHIMFSKRHNSLVLFSSKNEKHWEESRKIVEKIWPKVNKKLKLFISDINEGKGVKLSEFCGVKEKDLPKVFIIEPVNSTPPKYIFNEKITEENLLKFVNDWENKKIKPYLRSEEEPEENDGDIFNVVGKTFKKEVLDNDKDVLVYFYAPWCRYCKEYYPRYEKLARKLKKKNPHLLFTKVDITENDIEGMPITQYPTVKFFPGNAKHKEPIHCMNKLSSEDLLNLIKQKAYHKINSEDFIPEQDKKTTDL